MLLVRLSPENRPYILLRRETDKEYHLVLVQGHIILWVNLDIDILGMQSKPFHVRKKRIRTKKMLPEAWLFKFIGNLYHLPLLLLKFLVFL